MRALLQTNYCPNVSSTIYWYSNMAGAVSVDGGASYQLISGPDPAPGVLVSPYPWSTTGGWNQGISQISNIVQNSADGLWYLLAQNPAALVVTPGSLKYCLWRSTDITDPTAWRAWDGATYSVVSFNPYTTNLTGRCLGVSQVGDSLSWNTVLGSWLAVGSYSNWFSTAVSTNLTTWSSPVGLETAAFVPSDLAAPFSGYGEGYSSIIDLELAGNDANFGKTGATPHLYYLRFNPDGTRDTVRQQITIT